MFLCSVAAVWLSVIDSSLKWPGVYIFTQSFNSDKVQTHSDWSHKKVNTRHWHLCRGLPLVVQDFAITELTWLLTSGTRYLYTCKGVQNENSAILFLTIGKGCSRDIKFETKTLNCRDRDQPKTYMENVLRPRPRPSAGIDVLLKLSYIATLLPKMKKTRRVNTRGDRWH